MVVGTSGYMSPEQVRGEAVDARSDLFSVGTILYEMLAGRPAFARETAAETMAAILKEDPPQPLSTEVSPALARIVHAVSKNRARRGFSRRAISRRPRGPVDTSARAAPAIAVSMPRAGAAPGVTVVVLSL
jgi:serine/threonine protein kinase